MGVGPFPGFQFLATFIRGSEHRRFRLSKCPAPGTSGPLFFSKVQNATFQNGSGGLVVPRIFGQTDIGLWPCTSGALFFPEVQNATFQNGSGGLVVPRIFGQTDIGFWKNEKKMIADFVQNSNLPPPSRKLKTSSAAANIATSVS